MPAEMPETPVEGAEPCSESSDCEDDNDDADYKPHHASSRSTRYKPSRSSVSNMRAPTARMSAHEVIDLTSETNSPTSTVARESRKDSPACELQAVSTTKPCPTAARSAKRSRSPPQQSVVKRSKRNSNVRVTDRSTPTCIIVPKLPPLELSKSLERKSCTQAPPESLAESRSNVLASPSTSTPGLADWVRYQTMASSVLAEYVNAPVAQRLLEPISFFTKEQLGRVRIILQRYPAARTDFTAFLRAMSGGKIPNEESLAKTDTEVLVNMAKEAFAEMDAVGTEQWTAALVAPLRC